MLVLLFCEIMLLMAANVGEVGYIMSFTTIGILELFRAAIAYMHNMDGYGWFYKILSRNMNKKEVSNYDKCKSNMDKRDD